MDSIPIKKIFQVGLENNLKQYSKNATLHDLDRYLWEVTDETRVAIERVFKGVPFDSLSEREKTVMLIICNCFSDYIAGVDCLSKGFHRPAAVIFRSCIENVSMAIAAKNDENIYNDYVRGDYHIPKAVSFARSLISEIGKVYGLLTNDFVHEPYKAVGRAIRITGDQIEFMFVPPIDSNDSLTQTILTSAACLCSNIIGEVAEWTAAEYLSEMTYWEYASDNELRTKNTTIGKRNVVEISKILAIILGKDTE